MSSLYLGLDDLGLENLRPEDLRLEYLALQGLCLVDTSFASSTSGLVREIPRRVQDGAEDEVLYGRDGPTVGPGDGTVRHHDKFLWWWSSFTWSCLQKHT